MNDGKMKFIDAQHAHKIQTDLISMGYQYEHGVQAPRLGAYGIKFYKYGAKKLMITLGNKGTFNNCSAPLVTELFQPVTKCTREESNITDRKAIRQAVKTALQIVCGALEYDLLDQTTQAQREKRRLGWLAFCQCIQILHPDYKIKSLLECINEEFPKKVNPGKDTMKNWFAICNTQSKYNKAQIRSLLYPELAIG